MVASRRSLAAKARRIDDMLAEAYPEAGCALDFENPLECLVSTILSAQTTDKQVNTVTPGLFRKFPDVGAFARARPEDIEPCIRKLGLYRTKAKNIVAAAAAIIRDFGGEVPDAIEALTTLPGVGRKTANCVVLNAYGKPGIMCDTHFCRVTRRLGLHGLDDPGKIEAVIARLLDPERWGGFSHRMIIHGRARCRARGPKCPGCPLLRDCGCGGMR